MEQTISANHIGRYTETRSAQQTKAGLLKRFMIWAEGQEEKRFFWLGLALMGGIGAIVPLTLFAIILFAQNSFVLWTIVSVLNVPVLITNLSAQPTSVTIPAFFFSCIVNLAVIIYSILIFLV